MTATDVKKLLTRQPFQAFRLVMSSGKSYEVKHPEMAFVMKNDVLVGLHAADDGLPTEFDICPLLHVATVEQMVDRPASG
jgi:hypothetical protein